MSILNKDFKIKQEGNLRTLEIYLYGDIQGDYYNFWGDKVESKTSANYVKNALGIKKKNFIFYVNGPENMIYILMRMDWMVQNILLKTIFIYFQMII